MSCIRLENSLRPLTDEEREFAGERYKIIYRVMHDYKISDNDCFDELLFYYFNAVQRWFTIPELHQWSFNTIAYHGIEGGIKYYKKKMVTHKAPLSLDADLDGDGSGERYNIWTLPSTDNIAAIFIDYEEIERAAKKQKMVERIKQKLTARQLEIATFVSNGFTYAEVADMLGIAKGTVGCTMWNIKNMVERGELVYSI